jgi:hypothetical protein
MSFLPTHMFGGKVEERRVEEQRPAQTSLF